MRALTHALTILALMAVIPIQAPARAAESITLEPVQDNTMYEEGGDLSNGVGSYLFFGRTNDGFRRRALLLFDVAGNIPAGSTILSARLGFQVDRQPPGAPEGLVTLYRSEASWGEEASNATGNEGAGAQAEPGDATWTYRLYGTVLWVDPGGELIQPATATVLLSTLGNYEFSGTELSADVQDMLDVPSTNFGWIVVGDELVASRSARRIGSRENLDGKARPKLIIDYDPPVPAVGTSMGMLKSGYQR